MKKPNESGDVRGQLYDSDNQLIAEGLLLRRSDGDGIEKFLPADWNNVSNIPSWETGSFSCPDGEFPVAEIQYRDGGIDMQTKEHGAAYIRFRFA